MEHTPLPWQLIDPDPARGRHVVQIRATEGQEPKPLVADCHLHSNAAFIVRAANNHAKLLEALEEMLRHGEHDGPCSNDEDEACLLHVQTSQERAVRARAAIEEARK